jgi:hypothetical protein
MLGFAEHPWCHPAALRAARMTGRREICDAVSFRRGARL